MAERKQPPPQGGEDLAEKIAQYLSRKPYELVDAARLMRRFRASAADVQAALQRLEQLLPEGGEEPTR